MKTYTLPVDPGQKTMRLDQYLTTRIDNLSRSFAQRLIEGGKVRVDGSAEVKSSLKIQPGQTIEVEIATRRVVEIDAEDIPLDVLYEDKHVLVINKQPGLVVHPSFGNWEGTLANGVLHHMQLTKASGFRPGIVHRLDKDTSGVMIVAKNDEVKGFLQKQFQKRTVEKTYLALVRGIPEVPEGVIDSPIGRHPKDRQRMAVIASGKPARTRFSLLKSYHTKNASYSLLRVKLETGRTHQIRVHLASIHLPIAGDPTYGVDHPKLSRQFLHAFSLKLRLPDRAQDDQFTAPLSDDLEAFLKQLATA